MRTNAALARSRFASIALLATVFTASPRIALADDSPEVIHAREEFSDGIALMAAQDWAGALAKFKDVSHVKMSANVAFNMGECEGHLGLVVEALGSYRIASAKAQDGSAPKVAEQVDARIAAIEKRIAHLNLQRDEPKPNPSAKLQIDGIDVAPSQLGAPIEVNPGARVVTVVVHDKVVHSENVTLDEGGEKTVKIAIPEPVEGDDSSPLPDQASRGPSIPGIAVTSVGGASLIVGLVFIGLRQKAIGDLNGVCDASHVCPASAKSTYDGGRTDTGVAEVTIPVGVVGLAVGVALIVTHAKKAPPKEPARLEWSPSAPDADGPGASLRRPFLSDDRVIACA